MFPNKLKRHISELENDILNVEAKLNLLKLECEKTKQIKIQKSVKKKPAGFKIQASVDGKPVKCHCCCSVKQKDCSEPLEVNVDGDEKIVGQKHVHQKLRIPMNMTWNEILSKNKEKSNPDTPKVVTKRSVGGPSPPRAIPQPGLTKRTAIQNQPKLVKDHGLSLLQKEVREAQDEKEEAERKVAVQALALDKMRVLLEAKAACDQHKQNIIEAAKKTIMERLAVERRNASMMQIEAALKQIRAESQSTLSETGNDSSRRFRHSSPTPSRESQADATEDWNDISSIQGNSFSTL